MGLVFEFNVYVRGREVRVELRRRLGFLLGPGCIRDVWFLHGFQSIRLSTYVRRRDGEQVMIRLILMVIRAMKVVVQRKEGQICVYTV